MMAPSNEAQNDKLRIVHVFRAPLGGLFRHVVDLAAEQSARGHDVGMYFDANAYDDRVKNALARIPGGLKLGVGTTPIHRNPGVSDLAAMARFVTWLRKVKPDVVHGHGSKGGVYARFSGLGRARANAIRAYTPHGGSFNYRPGTPLHRAYMFAEKLAAPLTDVFLFESAYIASRFDAFVGARNGVRRIVANGIGPAELIPAAPREDAADLLYVGELRAAKGIDTLLDAIALIGRSRGAVPSAVLVGSGPDQAILTERANRLGIAPFVSFPGPMPIREAFALGRVMVVPSRAESMPCSKRPARACRWSRRMSVGSLRSMGRFATASGRPTILRICAPGSKPRSRRRRSIAAKRPLRWRPMSPRISRSGRWRIR
jgi:glycosyltransferase involved in cell wall biosynthesis